VFFLPLAVRLALAAIFLVAGTAKIADLQGSVEALGEFGAPRFLLPLGRLLPPVEIAVALGLVFTRTAHDAAWVALALLILFIAGMAVNLTRGRRPACHCFGQLRVRPIGPWTLARNAVLAAAAAWLVIAGRQRAAVDLWAFLRGLDSTGRRIATVIAALIVFAALSALTRKSPAEIEAEERATEEANEEEPEAAWEPRPPAPAVSETTAAAGADTAPSRVRTGMGLPVGTPAPAFVLSDPDGRMHSLDELRASGKALLLVFSSPHCGACQTLAPKLPVLAARHASTLQMVVITGESAAHAERGDNGSGPLVLIQRASEIGETYDCTTIPAAVIVGPDGVIRSRMAVGAPEIEQLAATSDS